MAEPLFDASELFVREHGTFLPHGAVLGCGGEVRLMMAAADDLDAPTSAADVLPRLHDSLRAAARHGDVDAIAVCESVTVTLPGRRATRAVNVLVEHRRGPTVALYLPWKRKLFGGYVFGRAMAVSADPEIKPWGDGAGT